MKFLFVVSDFDMGGITTSLKNLTDELIRRGEEVSILNLPNADTFPVDFHPDIQFIPLQGRALKWNIGMEDYRKASGVKKISLLAFGIFKKLLTRVGLWKKFIFAPIQTIQCDVAIAYRQSSECYYLISHKTTARRTIAFIHSEFDGDCSAWIPPLKDVDKIACVSNDWSIKFRNAFPALADKVGTVYNLFDADSIIEKANQFAPPYDGDVFNIVTVARIETPQKKIETIPEICTIVQKKTGRKIRWYIVGDGSDRPLVEDAIRATHTEDSVLLLGAKRNPYPYIKNADLFVLTSSWESYGMVVQEALILGTPVVAGNYGALKEIVQNPLEGIITENNIDGIADGIIRLLNNQELHCEMKKYLEKYQYSADIVYRQLLSMCEKER